MAHLKKSVEQASGYKDRWWIPRFWNGMSMSGWFPLLARNRFQIGVRCMVMALINTCITPVNAAFWAVQALLFGRRIARTEIKDDPIFIVGHWRSGTTMLHELLVLDERHTYPDTYQCFAPNHFLVSSWFFRRMLRLLLPSRRPMDNMAAGWDRPQEDEFALCNMGIRSPYLTIAFPNRPPQDQEYFELKDVPPEELGRWKQALLWFLKCLTLNSPKRIVLKSPAHTFRLKTLTQLFPDARFIHIVRDPYVILPSTVNLWKRLYRDEGFQTPKYEGLEEHIFRTFSRMYRVFQRDRRLIEPSRFCEVRYEDLVADPIGQMRTIYDRLELGGFDEVLPALEKYVADQADYRTNRYEISSETRAEISRRWSAYIEQYGYSPQVAEV